MRNYFDKFCLGGFFLQFIFLFLGGMIEKLFDIKFYIDPTVFWLLFLVGEVLGVYGVFRLNESLIHKIIICIILTFFGFAFIFILGFVIALIWGAGGAQ
jgi:hypothetical protein